MPIRVVTTVAAAAFSAGALLIVKGDTPFAGSDEALLCAQDVFKEAVKPGKRDTAGTKTRMSSHISPDRLVKTTRTVQQWFGKGGYEAERLRLLAAFDANGVLLLVEKTGEAEVGGYIPRRASPEDEPGPSVIAGSENSKAEAVYRKVEPPLRKCLG